MAGDAFAIVEGFSPAVYVNAKDADVPGYASSHAVLVAVHDSVIAPEAPVCAFGVHARS